VGVDEAEEGEIGGRGEEVKGRRTCTIAILQGKRDKRIIGRRIMANGLSLSSPRNTAKMARRDCARHRARFTFLALASIPVPANASPHAHNAYTYVPHNGPTFKAKAAFLVEVVRALLQQLGGFPEHVDVEVLARLHVRDWRERVTVLLAVPCGSLRALSATLFLRDSRRSREPSLAPGPECPVLLLLVVLLLHVLVMITLRG